MEQTIPQTVSRESLGAKVGLFSTIGNVVLFVCKYLAGTLCGNVAVLAESFGFSEFSAGDTGISHVGTEGRLSSSIRARQV